MIVVLPRYNAKENTKVTFTKRGNDFLPQITQLMGSSKESVWFFGTNFHITATDRRKDILGALERGVHVRFMVIDPKASESIFKQMSVDFDQSEETIKSECILGISSLKEIQKTWTERQPHAGSTATFEVRTYMHYPWARMYCFDPKSPNGTTFLIPYMNKTNSSELPGFLFENSPDGAAEEYFAAMVRIWNDESTKPLE